MNRSRLKHRRMAARFRRSTPMSRAARALKQVFDAVGRGIAGALADLREAFAGIVSALPPNPLPTRADLALVN